MFNRRCNYKNLEDLIKENKEELLKDKKALEVIERRIEKRHDFSNKLLSG
ncbi:MULTISPECIES: FbpB family small basic protein [Priestia]|nr:FbpB family small basic protein [Priestia megaterium]UYP07317.1 FbpB family small basic protein [Priestia megaterium]SDE43787.1 Fur-regulated basic protein B [Priestia aryabhattai B8W22]